MICSHRSIYNLFTFKYLFISRFNWFLAFANMLAEPFSLIPNISPISRCVYQSKQ